MAVAACLGDNCHFEQVEKLSDMEHYGLRALYAPLPLVGLYVCNKHHTLHLCRPGLDRRDCMTGDGEICLISGLYGLTRRTHEPPILPPPIGDLHAYEVMEVKFSLSALESSMEDFMTGLPLPTDDRWGSMVQRLHALCVVKDSEVRLPTTRIDKWEKNVMIIGDVLREEFGNVGSSNISTSFGRSVALLVCHDRTCDSADLMVTHTTPSKKKRKVT